MIDISFTHPEFEFRLTNFNLFFFIVKKNETFQDNVRRRFRYYTISLAEKLVVKNET